MYNMNNHISASHKRGIMKGSLGERSPKFYGATVVGERGQIVIPAEARRDMEITPGTRLLVLGPKHAPGLMLTKAESMTEFLAKAMDMMARFERMLKADEELLK